MSLSRVLRRLRLPALALAVLCTANTAFATPFSVLTYNIHGLPPQIEVSPGVFVPGNPDSPVTVPQIAGSLATNIASWDVVAIQEAFVPAYYDAVNAASPNTPPIDSPVPPAIAASGLTRLSQDPFTEYARETWGVCGPNKDDCAANKGFSMARHDVLGETLDIYNLHLDSGREAADFAARSAQLTQLANAIDIFSDGNAVIVLGDTNSLFTRIEDSIPSFLATTGLSDAWVALVNGGVIPAAGASPLPGCTDDAVSDAAVCERIDKVFFRSSSSLSLLASDYSVPAELFQDMSGAELSDHRPVQVIFDAQVVPEPGTATLLLAGLAGLAGRRRRS